MKDIEAPPHVNLSSPQRDEISAVGVVDARAVAENSGNSENQQAKSPNGTQKIAESGKGKTVAEREPGEGVPAHSGKGGGNSR